MNNSLERASSGKRINRAKDDAAGLAIAAQLAASATVSLQGSRNISYAQSAIQIGDSAMAEVSNITMRMQELATQSASGALGDSERATLNAEFTALSQEANRIVATTQFNGVNLLQGGGFSVQVGGDSSADSQISVGGVDSSSITTTLASLDISSQAGAQAAIDQINQSIQNLAAARGTLGAASKQLEFANNNNLSKAENETAARSRIEDADIAAEAAFSTAARIRTQTSSALLAQAGRLNADTVQKLLS